MTDITKEIEEKLQQKEAEIVESIFPKGCKERGKAITLNALLHVAFCDALAENNQRVKDLIKSKKVYCHEDNKMSGICDGCMCNARINDTLDQVLQELEAEEGK